MTTPKRIDSVDRIGGPPPDEAVHAAYFDQPYVTKLAALPIERGSVVVVNVLHDDGCALLGRAGPCNCCPDVEVADGG